MTGYPGQSTLTITGRQWERVRNRIVEPFMGRAAETLTDRLALIGLGSLEQAISAANQNDSSDEMVTITHPGVDLLPEMIRMTIASLNERYPDNTDQHWAVWSPILNAMHVQLGR